MRIQTFLGACGSVAVLLVSQRAEADVSSWYSIAPGLSVIDQGSTLASPLLDVDAGLGTTPEKPFVFGGIFHLGAQFEVGADLGGALRFCSGSYARGDWGFGADLGTHYRVATFGGAAASGRILLGAPLGLVLHIGGSYGEGGVGTLSASLGLDFARLSTHRRYLTHVLPSPLASPDMPEDSPTAPPVSPAPTPQSPVNPPGPTF